MSKAPTPTLATTPEAVLTAWDSYIKSKGISPDDVVGRMHPGDQYVWEYHTGKPTLAVIDGVGITEVTKAQYAEVIDAITKGHFSITAYDRHGEVKAVLHKATGLPLAPVLDSNGLSL